jgi:hypothetical protein
MEKNKSERNFIVKNKSHRDVILVRVTYNSHTSPVGATFFDENRMFKDSILIPPHVKIFMRERCTRYDNQGLNIYDAKRLLDTDTGLILVAYTINTTKPEAAV